MRIRFSLFLGGVVFLVAAKAVPSMAEDKIQSYVNSNTGKLVFTNLVENSSFTAPLIAGRPDVLTEPIPASLKSLVDTISLNNGVDPELVRAVIQTESNFNRWAVSHKGALGLMQLIPETGRRYGVLDFFDPQQNVDGGVRHLRFLLEKFNGNLDLSLAAYNAGENLVERLGRIPQIPETTNYVRKIRAIYTKKSAPVAPSAAPVEQGPAKPEAPKMFRVIDERGVVHFSNIEPPS